MLPAILNDDGIIVVLDYKSYTVKRTDKNYLGVIEAWKIDDILTLKNILEPKRAIEKILTDGFSSDSEKNEVSIVGGQLLFNGEVIHNSFSTRILDFHDQGLPTGGLILFLKNLMSNPSFHSRKQLYNFLEHKGLPITEDGYFLAYKAIRNNWNDKWTNTICNAVGNTPSMPRNMVDDDPNNHCSEGLHAGTLEYATNYGYGDDRIILVKLNPANVVSVPNDYNFTKLRSCGYEVLCECEGLIERPLVNSFEPYDLKAHYGEDCDDCEDEDYDPEWDGEESDVENYDDEQNEESEHGDDEDDDIAVYQYVPEYDELMLCAPTKAKATIVVDQDSKNFEYVLKLWIENRKMTITNLAKLAGMTRQRLSDALNHEKRSRKPITSDEQKELLRAMAFVERSF